MEEKLQYIFNKFQHNGEFDSYKELASGHINDTYLIRTKGETHFVLQRINHVVFKDVPGLMKNKTAISQHIQKKLKNLPITKQKQRVLRFVSTKQGRAYYQGDQENYWNMMYFIDDSVTYENVKNDKVAYEGGRLMGTFLNLTDDFNASSLVEVIPNFHDMSYRFSQFDEALKSAKKEPLNRAKDYIQKSNNLREEMHILQKLKETGKIKTRVTHNDTKISNILFNKKGKGLCVIDTDTVMPGIVHYDFGDAIRTICNTTSEDEKNLNLVDFNMNYYKAYSKGFLKKMKHSLSDLEIETLPLGAKVITFIMALRFLTDYLNGNIYYKVKYPDHNFDRAKNQFKFLDVLTTKLSIN